jgi:ABC-2 type transport system ATP-binding protein
MSVFIRVLSVSKKYGSRYALNDINLDIYSGEVITLLGPNGAGKTTLSSIIASLHPVTSGDILYEERSIYQDLIGFRKILGFCPQKPNFSANLTVRQHLEFAGRFYLIHKNIIHRRVNELMEQFNLKEYENESPTILSGGYKQRLLIARALLHNPKLVILDEPTVALDPHIRRQLWEIIRALKKEGVTVVLTTHYIDEAEILSDRVCVLDKGLIRLIDTPGNLISSYDKSKLEDVFLQLMVEATDDPTKKG